MIKIILVVPTLLPHQTSCSMLTHFLTYLLNIVVDPPDPNSNTVKFWWRWLHISLTPDSSIHTDLVIGFKSFIYTIYDLSSYFPNSNLFCSDRWKSFIQESYGIFPVIIKSLVCVWSLFSFLIKKVNTLVSIHIIYIS